MLELLLGVITSSGFGTMIGAAGALVTKWFETKTLRTKLDHEVSMAKVRIMELKIEHEHALALADKHLEVAQIEGDIAQDVGELAAFVESQKASRERYGGVVDKLRGMMRPGITLYLLLWSTVLFMTLYALVDGLEALSAELLLEIFKYMIFSIFSLTATAVTWWFGSRWSNKDSPRL